MIMMLNKTLKKVWICFVVRWMEINDEEILKQALLWFRGLQRKYGHLENPSDVKAVCTHLQGKYE